MTAAQHPKHLRPAPSIRPEAPAVDFSPRIAAVPPPPPSTRRPAETSGTEVQLFSSAATSPALADLVQNECMRGLTRAMKVQSQTKRGVLYFDQGQIVHAEFEQKTGVEAACEILAWEEGRMAPGNEFWLQSPSIDTSWQGLLMMAAQRKDEAARSARQSYIAERSSTTERQVVAPPLERPLIRGIKRKVTMLTNGTLLSSEGDARDFSDTVAYTLRLAELIGEGLGLEAFDAMECTAEQSTMVIFRDHEKITALDAADDSDLTEYRKRCGL